MGEGLHQVGAAVNEEADLPKRERWQTVSLLKTQEEVPCGEGRTSRGDSAKTRRTKFLVYGWAAESAANRTSARLGEAAAAVVVVAAGIAPPSSSAGSEDEPTVQGRMIISVPSEWLTMLVGYESCGTIAIAGWTAIWFRFPNCQDEQMQSASSSKGQAAKEVEAAPS